MGLFIGPARCEEDAGPVCGREAGKSGSTGLHRLLTRLDPGAARLIHPHDQPKLIRALEVRLLAGRPISRLWSESREPLRVFLVLRIGLDPDRETLYQRINRRARAMFENGLVEETQILRQQHGNSAWALGSLGYKQAMQHLRGETTLEEAIAAAQQGHRNYAKRQATWFRAEPEVQWINGFGDEASGPATDHGIGADVLLISGHL